MLRAFIPLYTVITYVILCNYLSILGWFPPHCLRSILKPRRIVSPGLPRWFGCLISAWYSEWSCIVFYGVSPFIWSFHSYHQMDIKWIQGYHRYMEFGCLNGVVSPFYWPKPNCVLFLDIHRCPQLCCFYQFYHEVFKWQCPSSSLFVDIPIFFTAHTVSQFCFVFDRWIPNLPASPQIHIKRLRISRPFRKSQKLSKT